MSDDDQGDYGPPIDPPTPPPPTYGNDMLFVVTTRQVQTGTPPVASYTYHVTGPFGSRTDATAAALALIQQPGVVSAHVYTGAQIRWVLADTTNSYSLDFKLALRWAVALWMTPHDD